MKTNFCCQKISIGTESVAFVNQSGEVVQPIDPAPDRAHGSANPESFPIRERLHQQMMGSIQRPDEMFSKQSLFQEDRMDLKNGNGNRLFLRMTDGFLMNGWLFTPDRCGRTVVYTADGNIHHFRPPTPGPQANQLQLRISEVQSHSLPSDQMMDLCPL
jgi:hypothetical protein